MAKRPPRSHPPPEPPVRPLSPTPKFLQGVFHSGMSVDSQRLGDTIGRFTRCGPFAICRRSSKPIFGLPILIPFAFARAIPAFVRSLIFCASTFARDDSRASRIFRTNSLSVASTQNC